MSKIKVDKIESVDGTKVLITKDMWKALPTAWVSFGKTGVIEASGFNVSSVVREAMGTYLITFSQGMDNTNYGFTYGGVVDESAMGTIGNKYLQSCRVETRQASGSFTDKGGTFVFFGGKD